MGYDMSLRKEVDGEKEAMEHARAVFDTACKAREAVEAGRGTFAPGERERNGFDAVPENSTQAYKDAQAAVSAAYDAMDSANTSYFRLNIWGMGRYRAIMALTGMAYDGDIGPFPELDWELMEPIRYPEYADDSKPLSDEDRIRAEKMVEELERHLSTHNEEIPGIPLFKFGSNDGWIVTPAECQAALAAFDRFISAQPRQPRAITDGTVTGEVVGQALKQFILSSQQGRLDMVQRALKAAEPVGWSDSELAEMAEEMSGDYFTEWLGYLNRAITHDGFEVH